MSKLDLQYDIANGQPGNALPVEANFNRIEQHINAELIERGGTVGMTAELTLSGTPIGPLSAVPRQYVDAIMPIGIIVMWGDIAPPAGGLWRNCDGSLLSTGAFPELFARFQYRFGGSGGSFGLPPLMNANRFPRGNAVPGGTGGSADAVLIQHLHGMSHNHPDSTSEIENQGHLHAVTDHLHTAGGLATTFNGNHAHGFPAAGSSGFVGNGFEGTSAGLGTGGGFVFQPFTTQNGDHQHGVTGFTGAADRALATGDRDRNHVHTTHTPTFNGNTVNAGAGTGVGANLPPFVDVAYIVRVL